MTLRELIEAVNEKNLPVEKLEEYRDDMVNLFAKMQFELAEIKKKKAMYFLEHPEKTDVGTERKWQGSKEGQREIELSHWSKATEKIISSLKNRIYKLY